MSDISLYAGLYGQMRQYAELVDIVLVDLKSGMSKPTDTQRRALADFLLGLCAKQRGDLITQRLARILDVGTGITLDSCQRAALALRSESIDDWVVGLLETLAKRLEENQVRVMAKMRGGVR